MEIYKAPSLWPKALNKHNTHNVLGVRVKINKRLFEPFCV